MKRTHNNGQLRIENINQEVSLIGWVSKKRNFGSIIFVDLRDRYGITQVVFDESKFPLANELRSEFLIEISGQVVERKDYNPKLATGEIEVIVSEFKLINKSKQTPLLIQDNTDALEETRMKYRYLDLRRPIMQERLIKRAKIVKAMHHYLDSHDFIEVETPMLTKSTPEGSREYLVPSRVHPGEFYALAQSPQIFKQMLMISGFERYYQIARCFRDEDLRADRQLDFTQVDIETSFLDEIEFQTIIEEMVHHVFKEVMDMDIQIPFERIPFDKAMNLYGSDKPDTRFEMKLHDLVDVFQDSTFKVFQQALTLKNGTIKAIVLHEGASSTRKEIDGYTDIIKKNGGTGLVTLKYQDNQLSGSAIKFFTESEIEQLINTLGLTENDLVCIVSGPWEKSCNALGTLRTHFRDKFLDIDKNLFNFAWVTEFPMFELDEESNKIVARHHPFTRPDISDISELYKDTEGLLEIKAIAYDLVLNGFEVAGGSMRIYDGEMQSRFFEIIGFTPEQIKTRFGFFIDAFNYGTPPHGGIAFGLDRFAMILAYGETIRDVIAFPKNSAARDPLTMAPSLVDEKQLKELHLEIKES
ncbi:MAG: aspartate--tRNA ligase [Erysipelothrix sp.]|nr:aspartate--tRNA ligase [Erysipelothrix sp.]